MNKRSFMITTLAALLLAMLATGYAAIAAEYGSAEDPLITQSYLDSVLTPKMQKQITQSVSEAQSGYQNAIDNKIAGLQNTIDDKLTALADDKAFAEAVAAAGGTVSGEWKAVTIASGKTLQLSAGTQVVLRSGKAVCAASGGVGLTNLSQTYKLGDGESMTVGNLYEATAENAGARATSAATALVLGAYTLA